MISERKLRSLKPETRHRKIGRLLYEFEIRLRRALPIDMGFLEVLLSIVYDELELTPEESNASIREVNRARHAIRSRLGEDPAEWDLLEPIHQSSGNSLFPASGVEANPRREGLRLRVYLEEIRSPYNVGSIFRTAAAYDVTEIVLSPSCASPDHPRAIRSAMGAIGMIPWRRAPLTELEGAETFALETGGTAISRFEFPESGIVVLGSEELGISPAARSMVCERRGICSIELPGAKATLNVSVAFGILIEYWHRSVAKPGVSAVD